MATLDPLILDLVEWCVRERRSYAEVIEAWRTSCPRLTVWEDAMDRRLLVRKPEAGGTFIEVTRCGRQFLKKYKDKAKSSALAVSRSAPPPVH